MLFVDEPGCQRLSRGVLKEVAAHTVDLDIQSAQLTICDQLVRKLGVKDREHFETAMRVLEEVAPDRDAWVMQHLGMGPAEGKDLLLTTLGGKRPPAALANNPSVQAVVRLSRFLRWLACSALPNTYAAYCEENASGQRHPRLRRSGNGLRTSFLAVGATGSWRCQLLTSHCTSTVCE